MRFSKSILALSIGAAIASISLPSQACFTVIVGKDASATGEILIGHNEDNDRRIITNQYWVPAADHKAGEMIEFEPSAAKIPQVKHTLGFWWTQTLAPEGSSFSDGFINEKGVVVVSNNCNITIEKDQKVNDGGIGYGIRRIVAERANSAREGVDIVIDLMKKYGYFHMGRTYTIADRNEAWQISLLRGHRYLARKVGDNEIAFIANAFAFDKVDLKDPHVIASPDLIEHAIEMGAYKPAKAGDYSDFSFREAYQPEARRVFPRNKERVFTLLEMVTGKEYKDTNDYPAYLPAPKKYTVEDVQAFMRGHSKFEKRQTGWHHETMQDICNIGTFDSVVFKLAKDPLLTMAWRTAGRPSEQLYTPAFPLAGPAMAQTYMTPEVGTRAQFHATPEQVSWSADRPIYTFLAQQFFLDWMAPARNEFMKIRNTAEKEKTQAAMIAQANAAKLAKVDREKAREYLHTWNVGAFNQSLGEAAALVQKLNTHVIAITKPTLSQADKGTVDVVLYSAKGFDATKLDQKATFFGSPYPDGSIELNKEMAKPAKVVFKDVDADGLKDAVITFPVKGAAAFSFAGVDSELYLFTKVDGKPIAAFDTVKFTK